MFGFFLQKFSIILANAIMGKDIWICGIIVAAPIVIIIASIIILPTIGGILLIAIQLGILVVLIVVVVGPGILTAVLLATYTPLPGWLCLLVGFGVSSAIWEKIADS